MKKLNFQVFFWQIFANKLRPLNHAYTCSVEILLQTKFIRRSIFQTVHVHMIKWQASFLIFTNDCKCRTFNHLRNQKTFTETFGKSSFTRAEITFKQNHISSCQLFTKLFCAKPCLSFTCHYQFEFHYLTRPSFSLHIIPQSRAKIKIKKNATT
ncbi:ATP/GTP hydrolase [Listeria monocytogenes]|nr:ATP/GTP hydrolase [Listeria monocytogenes]